MDFAISVYGCIFLFGILSNGSLGLTLGCGSGARSHNPFLFGVIIADFLVCAVSGPITAALHAETAWSPVWAHFILILQLWPLSVSPLSMMVLSIDRFLTVKNYRPAGKAALGGYYSAAVLAAAWFTAGLLSVCQVISKHPWKKGFILARVVICHVLPLCVVIVTHFGVHAKLTALSLTARAKHGELPLPMPLLRRPTHVIIVAGIPKQDQDRLQAAEGNVEDGSPPPTSTLQSRRQLATNLLWVAFYFTGSWIPYCVTQFCDELGFTLPVTLSQYSLIIGHLHSCCSPMLYYSFNHHLRRPCHLRLPGLYRSASSTNEAALGPFHPRLVRPPPIRRRSSHYLY